MNGLSKRKIVPLTNSIVEERGRDRDGEIRDAY